MSISIQINNLSKKFVNEWIFKNLTLTIAPKEKWVILGANGSGKSTLLQSIAGFLIPTKGAVIWSNDNQTIESDSVYKHLSIASPYMELIEDFTLQEIIEHQKEFKPFQKNLSINEVVELMQLIQAKNKFIKNFSSGMKQRVKLGLAILADCPVLLLDEPCSNLDANSISWYQKMITEFAQQKTIIVCSNTVKEEYSFCDKRIEIEQFKV